MAFTKAQLVNDVRPSMALGNNVSDAVMSCDTDIQLQICSVGHAQLKLSGDRGNDSAEDKESRIIFSIDGTTKEHSAIRLGNYGGFHESGNQNNDNALILSAGSESSNYGGIVFETNTTATGNSQWTDGIPRVRIPNSGGLEIYGEIEGTAHNQVHRTVKLTGVSGNDGDGNKSVGLNIDGTAFLKIPTGTSNQRPATANAGYVRFNTTANKMEVYDGTLWAAVGAAAPEVTSIAIAGGSSVFLPAGGETVTVTGTSFSATPAVILIASDGSEYQATSETFVSSTSFTFVTPNVSADGPGQYDLKVTNPDGGTVTKDDFMTSSGLPAWQSPAANATIVDDYEAVTISNVTLSATDSDGGTVTYAVTSGSLPSGISLSSSGVISGTLPSVNANTNYNFTVTATDNESQTATRSFTITVKNTYVMTGSALFTNQ